MSLPIVITNAGLAKLPSPDGAGTSALTIAAIGVSATAFVPDPTMAALPGELSRVTTISGTDVTPNTIHLVMEDSSANAYSMLSFAVYLADGTLFAIYGQATAILAKTAGSVALLAIDIQFEQAVAGAITFGATTFNNPPASPTAMGVVQLATLAQAQGGVEAAAVLTPATAIGAVVNWLQGKNVVLNVADVTTPAVGGGLRVRANGTGIAFIQITDIAAGTQWGGWSHSAAGDANWHGAGNGYLYRASFQVWDAGNDGAGSGLDTDLWHGQTPAEFLAPLATTAQVDALFSSGSNDNGIWTKRSDGAGGVILEQWGTVNCDVTIDGPIAITFPTAFSDPTTVMVDGVCDNPAATTNLNCWIQRVSNTDTGAVMYVQFAESAGTLLSFRWRAIGKG